MKALFKISLAISVFTLILILASCSIEPTPASRLKDKNVNEFVQRASLESPVNVTNREPIIFSDRVTPQSLSFVEKLPRGAMQELRFVKKPKTGNLPQGKYKIWMGENTTTFKVRFKAGNSFAVLDRDASDGEAVVQMPANQIREGFTRVRGPRTKEQLRSLILQDELYHIKQELVRNDEGPGSFLIQKQEPKSAQIKKLDLNSVCSKDPDEYRLWKIENPNDIPVSYDWEIENTNQKGTDIAPPGVSFLETETESGENRISLSTDGKKDVTRVSVPSTCKDGDEPEAGKWWRFGLRPFPIPTDWLGPDGSDYVLSFTNQNVSSFTFRWAQTSAAKPDFPPGIAEIGPSGGVVELPGVAKLELPAGALASPTVVKITQIKEAPFRGEFKLPENDPLSNFFSERGTEYASPIVRIDPFNTRLQVPAKLTISLLDPTYITVKDGHVHDLVSHDLSDTLHGISTPGGRSNEIRSIFSPIIVDNFMYFSKLVTYGWLNEFKGVINKNTNQFHTAQVTLSSSPSPHDKDTPHFFFDNMSSRTSQQELDLYADLFEKIYNDYNSNQNVIKFNTDKFYSGLNRIQVFVYRNISEIQNKLKNKRAAGGFKISQDCYNNSGLNINKACFVEIHLSLCGVEEEKDKLIKDPNYRCPVPQIESGKGISHELVHYFQYTNQSPVTYGILQKFRFNDDWWIEGGAGWISDNYMASYLEKYPFADGKFPINSLEDIKVLLNPIFSVYPFDAGGYPGSFKTSDNQTPNVLMPTKYVKSSFFFHEFRDDGKFNDMKNILDKYEEKLVKSNNETEYAMKTYNAINDALDMKQKGRGFESAYSEYAKDAVIAKNINFRESDFYPVSLLPAPLGLIDENYSCSAAFRFKVPLFLRSLETSYILLQPDKKISDETLLIRTLPLEGTESDGTIENLNPEKFLNISAIGIDNWKGLAAEYNAGENKIHAYNSTDFDDLYDINLKEKSDKIAKISKFGYHPELHSVHKSQSVIVVASDARWPSQEIPCSITSENFDENIQNFDCSNRKSLQITIEACLAPKIYSVQAKSGVNRQGLSPGQLQLADKTVLFKARYLDPANTWFVFESRNPNVAPSKAKAVVSVATEMGTDGIPIQNAFVTLPPDAKIGGDVYAIAGGGATSNKLMQQDWPCSMLPTDIDFADFQTNSAKPCRSE